MKRKLVINEGIIRGDIVRDIVDFLPQLEKSFIQRKQFDEYYYNETVIELSIDIIQELTANCFNIEIGYLEATLTW